MTSAAYLVLGFLVAVLSYGSFYLFARLGLPNSALYVIAVVEGLLCSWLLSRGQRPDQRYRNFTASLIIFILLLAMVTWSFITDVQAQVHNTYDRIHPMIDLLVIVFALFGLIDMLFGYFRRRAHPATTG
jgi:predicted PurR-regulated permease PerM